MTQNKAAARVLEHPNGLECELTKTHKTILLHFVRFGKLFTKTCAVTLTLLGLAAFAGAVQGGGLPAVLAMLAAIVADNWALGAWFSLGETEAYLCAES